LWLLLLLLLLLTTIASPLLLLFLFPAIPSSLLSRTPLLHPTGIV
jgi:hypothetical protein